MLEIIAILALVFFVIPFLVGVASAIIGEFIKSFFPPTKLDIEYLKMERAWLAKQGKPYWPDKR